MNGIVNRIVDLDQYETIELDSDQAEEIVLDDFKKELVDIKDYPLKDGDYHE